MNNYILEIYNSVKESFLDIWPDLVISTEQTIYMSAVATFFALVLGFLLAICMIITGPHGIRPKPFVYRFFDVTINLLRSLPFIILILLVMPLTRIIVGTAIGTTASIVPLTIAAAPFAARLLEGSFLEVDKGVVEAAESFGASTWQIIFKVLLPEAMPAIVLNIVVLTITLIGYSAMAGIIAGGGLGDLAYRLGYNRFQTDVIFWCLILLILLVQAVQSIGNLIYKKIR